jgi:Secretion system C-terminal sorting domain
MSYKKLFFTLAVVGFSKTITASDLNAFVVDAASGAGSGSIDLTVTGGVAPFVFSWTGPSGFTATTEDITALDMGTYTVTVTDQYCGVATYSWLVDSISHIGITEINDSPSIFAYPNPGNSQITITANETFKNAAFSLKNVAGQTIMLQNNISGNTFVFDITSIVNGVYFIEMINEDNYSRIKFVKN